MRAALFLPDVSGGGAERAAVRLLQHWPEEAECPALIVRRRQGSYLEETRGLEVHELAVPRTGIAASAGTVLGVARLARTLALDVLVTFLSLASVIAAARLVPGLRTVWSVQTPVGLDGVAGQSATPLRTRALGALSRALLPLVDGVVLPARGLGETLPLASYSGAVEVIPNPVPMPALRDARQLGHGVPALVAVGRLVPLKRVELLVEAVSLVARRRPVTLTVYGEGPERARLVSLVDQLGLSASVRLAGFEPDLDRVYGDADLFVHAADYEGFGNVIVEAMSYGLPCVVTDAPYGPPEIVDGGRYGALVPRGSAAEIADAILRALPGGPDHQRLRNASAARAEAYAAPAVARRMHDFLLRVTRDASPGAVRPLVVSRRW